MSYIWRLSKIIWEKKLSRRLKKVMQSSPTPDSTARYRLVWQNEMGFAAIGRVNIATQLQQLQDNLTALPLKCCKGCESSWSYNLNKYQDAVFSADFVFHLCMKRHFAMVMNRKSIVFVCTTVITYFAVVSQFFQGQSINTWLDPYAAPVFMLLPDISCVLFSYLTSYNIRLM